MFRRKIYIRPVQLSRFLTIATIFLLISSETVFAQKRLTKEPRPSWTEKIIPGYFVGMSNRYSDEAEARTNAINDAKRKIIESLGVIINSETKDSIIEKSGKTTSLDAFTSSSVKVISKAIISVSPEKVFVEQWQEDSGRKAQMTFQAFVLVLFSEESHRAFMKEMMDETMNISGMRLTESLDLARGGNVFLAIRQIREAQTNFTPILSLTGLSPTLVSQIKSFSEGYKALADAMQGSITIEGSGEKQPVKLGAALEQPLTVSVFWTESAKRHPIPNLPVDFSLVQGKATFTPQGQTDASGKAICEVRNIESAGKIVIQAKVRFPEEFKIAQDTHTFNLLPENRVVVKIIETNIGKPVQISYLENALMGKFTGAGFTVVENGLFQKLTPNEIETGKPEMIFETAKNTGADLVIVGTVSSGQINKVQEGFYFGRARGSLKVFNIQKQTVVGNYLVEEKNSGNSEENAGSKAITKVGDLLVQKLMTEMGL